MNSNNSSKLLDEKLEQIERGKRIKQIRVEELHMNKSQLARRIGISGQFLGLIEEGKGNLVYRNLKKLMDISGHSADYILFGLDDSILDKTKLCLEKYSEDEIVNTLKVIKNITLFIKDF